MPTALFSDNRRSLPAAAAFVVFWLTIVGACSARERFSLDADWKFHQGDESAASDAAFDASEWRTVNLPHDWSIEGTTDKRAPSGRDGGYFPTGIGWYRRTFTLDENWQDKRIQVEFEGVYQDATVWINGHQLGFHAYGYTPFQFDLTPHLKFGEENVIAVRVDNSRQPNSRWYTGSGIYRHVWLNVYDSIHLQPKHCLVTTTNLIDGVAVVKSVAVVRNENEAPQKLKIATTILGPDGQQRATRATDAELEAFSETAAEFEFDLPQPSLWTTESPNLYTWVTSVSVAGQVRDEIRMPFGIRTISVSPDDGLEINGEHVCLYGGCVHHDNGPLGAAAFDAAEVRKAKLLKAAGFNAVRTAHNPPSTAFLDACDRLGLFVIDEPFDGWAQKKTAYDYSRVFPDQWQSDLDAMVLRDRRHPSTIMWSVGNEVYERGSESGRELVRKLSDRVRYWDTTRPVTAAVNGLGKKEDWPQLDGFFDHLDVAGYNYELQRHGEDHVRLPDRVMFASESYQSEAFANWAAMMEHPYVIGDFVWTAIDYLGEADIGRVFPPDVPARGHWQTDNAYPWHGAYCGDIDLTGWRKPISHYRQIVWDRGEKLYACVLTPSPTGKPWNLFWWSMPPALPSWTWPGREGQELEVEVYSRYSAVRLYLNDKLLGETSTDRDHKFKATFKVPYEPGTLRVVGLDNEREAEEFRLNTADSPSKLRLTADRETINADGQDLAFVTVEVVDAQGRLYPLANDSVKYELIGPAAIAGVASGDVSTTESYQANPRRVYQGRGLVVVRSTANVGKITLTASAQGLESATAEIEATSAR